MLRDACLYICEDATGANGPEICDDRPGRIHRAADRLCDYVYETLLESGISYGTVIDRETYDAIQHIVAAAMLAQYEYDDEATGELVAAICNEEKAIKAVK